MHQQTTHDRDLTAAPKDDLRQWWISKQKGMSRRAMVSYSWNACKTSVGKVGFTKHSNIRRTQFKKMYQVSELK